MKTVLHQIEDWFCNNVDQILVAVIGGLILAFILFVVKRIYCICKTTPRRKKAILTPSSANKVQFFSFDYDTRNGEYTFGNYPYNFTTKWTRGDRRVIHAYTDGANIDAIACVPAPIKIEEITENAINKINFSHQIRYKTCHVGDAIVWRNRDGHYAVTKIISIQDRTRGDNKDLLECEYVILKR